MQPALLWTTLGRYAALIGNTLFPARGRLAGHSPRHFAIGALLLALMPAYLLYQWLGLLLDELLFPAYRRVRIEKPVFIVGVPRSGTSALHATLADDEQFTTFRAWECLFAPSITWRRFWWAWAGVDRRLGAPAARLLGVLERRAFAPLETTHPMSLASPEEDYFVFMPLLYCFILVAAFPDAPWLWRFGRFDQAVPPRRRRQLMAHYRRCVQRHLYAHGTGRRYLAKNPTFSPLVASLAETFPDARFIACLREPAGAVSSQLSVLDAPLRALHGRYNVPAFQGRMTGQLCFYYRHLLETLGRLPSGQAVLVPAPALRRRLAATVHDIYQSLTLPLSAPFRQRLEALDRETRHGRSGHAHSLRSTTVDVGDLRRRLAGVYERFDFHGTQPVPARAALEGAALPHRETA